MPKKQTSTAVTIKIPDEMLKAIDRDAATNLRNRTTQVIWLLRIALEKQNESAS